MPKLKTTTISRRLRAKGIDRWEAFVDLIKRPYLARDLDANHFDGSLEQASKKTYKHA